MLGQSGGGVTFYIVKGTLSTMRNMNFYIFSIFPTMN